MDENHIPIKSPACRIHDITKGDKSFDRPILATAIKLMQSAADDLQAVAHALANIGRERMAA